MLRRDSLWATQGFSSETTATKKGPCSSVSDGPHDQDRRLAPAPAIDLAALGEDHAADWDPEAADRLIGSTRTRTRLLADARGRRRLRVQCLPTARGDYEPRVSPIIGLGRTGWGGGGGDGDVGLVAMVNIL
jgi:hypothetical protein